MLRLIEIKIKKVGKGKINPLLFFPGANKSTEYHQDS